MSAPQPVASLFVTLKRSFAGTREHHVRILRSLGLSYRQQTVEKPNVAHIRGAIDKASSRVLGRRRRRRRETSRCCLLQPVASAERALPQHPPSHAQVRHMVLVETDAQKAAREAAEAAQLAPRPPLRVRH